MSDKALQQVERLPSAEPVTPLTMLNMAVAKGTSIEQLQQLMALQERWEANEARKAYVAAMNAFKADPPEVFKSKHVSFETTKGVTEYNHAKLEDAVDAIGMSLSKHGLSFRWDCEQLEGGIVRVTCIITHIQGHSERTSLQAGADQSGGKNNIQALASSVTYLQRYTLFAATGLAPKGMILDDDGRGSEQAETISTDQAIVINDLLTETLKPVDKFLAQFKFESIESIPAKDYDRVILALNERKRKIEEKKSAS
jgi:hypothetical protein